jgi:multidrug efflux pump subunit AcrB
MYKGISAPFIHRPIAATLIIVAIMLVGLVAFPSLPVAPLPQVDFPTITVSASLPDGSPDTMATSVAQPLERQIAQIPGVSQMTSTSSLGTTAITVQFDLNRNIDAAANDIQAAINAAAGQLPAARKARVRRLHEGLHRRDPALLEHGPELVGVTGRDCGHSFHPGDSAGLPDSNL